MPDSLCPVCQAHGRSLEDSSKDAHVDYYRCDRCGHIWTPKGTPDAPPQDITIKPSTKDGEP